jgi:hypothetical protein
MSKNKKRNIHYVTNKNNSTTAVSLLTAQQTVRALNKNNQHYTNEHSPIMPQLSISDLTSAQAALTQSIRIAQDAILQNMEWNATAHQKKVHAVLEAQKIEFAAVLNRIENSVETVSAAFSQIKAENEVHAASLQSFNEKLQGLEHMQRDILTEIKKGNQRMIVIVLLLIFLVASIVFFWQMQFGD